MSARPLSATFLTQHVAGFGTPGKSNKAKHRLYIMEIIEGACCRLFGGEINLTGAAFVILIWTRIFQHINL